MADREEFWAREAKFQSGPMSASSLHSSESSLVLNQVSGPSGEGDEGSPHGRPKAHAHDSSKPDDGAGMSRAATSASLTEDVFNKSCFAKIANHDVFQNLTLAIIVSNALWIMIDTEWNHSVYKKSDGSLPLEPTSMYIENLYCGYFTMEVTFRFFSFRRKVFCLKDAWFVFDSFLVFFMVLETWILVIIAALVGGGGSAGVLASFSSLRLLRLLRLTRMARLMRQVPELMMLCKGILQATHAVFFIMLFLVMVMYVFAIIFTSAIAVPVVEHEPGTAKHLFGSMGDSMMTLFTNGVLGDNVTITVDAILAESTIMFWLFFIFFCISAMTLLNMLIGVLCEVIGGTAEAEKSSMVELGIRMCLEQAFGDIDQNSDGQISAIEWHAIQEDEKLRDMFIEAGWNPDRIGVQLDQMQTIIFPNTKDSEHPFSLDMEDLYKKVISVRPSKPSNLLDLKVLDARQERGKCHLKAELEMLEIEFKELLSSKQLPIPELPHGKDRKRMSPLHDTSPSGDNLVSSVSGTGVSPRPLKDASTEDLLRTLKGFASRLAPAANPASQAKAFNKPPQAKQAPQAKQSPSNSPRSRSEIASIC
jgi:voltage-gated sodium channel